MRLSIFDILHRGVVYSLLGISGWAIYVGVAGHKERKAALMQRAKGERYRSLQKVTNQQPAALYRANGGHGTAERRRNCISSGCAECCSVEEIFVNRDRVRSSIQATTAQ
ncbi:hypothetical protein MSAN_01657200 [Mycena sanguinolenta]|uniref:Uncharacterized protein n=1 Tax=Mycena sanguinolenta TaxID=230812 RepID=A0A8H7CUN6_9AGAR|nr:hypothetical protein MSAN_01657200 [Mycena sanguinolenta]